MTDAELLKAAKEIIATGCDCDRRCEDFVSAGRICRCENDAEKIIELVYHKRDIE